MNQRDIFAKTIPEPFTILGLRLLPFTLGHLELLHRIESAFVCGGSSSYDDLALSVFICSRSYEDAIDGFADPDLSKEMERWARKLTRKGKPINLGEKWLAFDAYLEAHQFKMVEGKDYIIHDKDRTRTVNIPMVHAVRVKLQSRMHFSDSEILNRAWALCLLDYYILQDADGLISLHDDDHTRKAIADAQAVADRVAKILKEKRNGS